MSGRPPVTNDPEWAREVERRLAGLERPTTIQMGPWTLHTGNSGELQARHVITGRLVVLTDESGS